METVTVQRAGVISDPFSGEETYDWSNPTEWVVEQCIVEPRTTDEPVAAGRKAVVTGYTLHMPFDTDITAYDRVILFGVSWEVDGYPFRWENPWSGWKAGIEVNLMKVDG